MTNSKYNVISFVQSVIPARPFYCHAGLTILSLRAERSNLICLEAIHKDEIATVETTSQ